MTRWVRRTFSVQHLANTTFEAHGIGQVLLLHAHLLHAKFYGFDRVRHTDGKMCIFVCIDENGQHFQLIAFLGTFLGIKDLIQPLQRRLIILLVPDRGDGHLKWCLR